MYSLREHYASPIGDIMYSLREHYASPIGDIMHLANAQHYVSFCDYIMYLLAQTL